VGEDSSNAATLTVITTSVRDVGGLPTAYTLEQSYPNPFNPATEIQYGIPRVGLVVLEVYSIVGGHVATLVKQTQSAGYYTVRFDAKNLPSGIYLYRLRSEGASLVKKMVLTK
jgi:hypothetical protein